MQTRTALLTGRIRHGWEDIQMELKETSRVEDIWK
jgi:hypothetical protein